MPDTAYIKVDHIAVAFFAMEPRAGLASRRCSGRSVATEDTDNLSLI